MKASEAIDQLYKKNIIPELEEAFANDPVAKKVAYMIATSHEYKKPNVKAALSFAKNYSWEVSNAKVKDLQGINKPIIEDKVASMAKQMKGKTPFPLICVNQLHGIRPQTPGKKVLVDGHHRIEACKVNGVDEVPIYKGTYTGKAERSFDELKKASELIDEVFEKVAGQTREQKINDFLESNPYDHDILDDFLYYNVPEEKHDQFMDSYYKKYGKKEHELVSKMLRTHPDFDATYDLHFGGESGKKLKELYKKEEKFKNKSDKVRYFQHKVLMPASGVIGALLGLLARNKIPSLKLNTDHLQAATGGGVLGLGAGVLADGMISKYTPKGEKENKEEIKKMMEPSKNLYFATNSTRRLNLRKYLEEWSKNNKQASLNASFEKVALNAVKAREMAKKVGLIPEGQWKWALRNLRGARGELLQGKELAKAKEGMGSLSNHQKNVLEAAARMAHGKEIKFKNTDKIRSTRAFTGERIGRNTGLTKGNVTIGNYGSVTTRSGGHSNTHTHPFREIVINKMESKRPLTKNEINNLLDEGYTSEQISEIKKFNKNQADRLLQNNYKMTTPSGDAYNSSGDFNIINKNKSNNNIYSPELKIEGIHKARNVIPSLEENAQWRKDRKSIELLRPFRSPGEHNAIAKEFNKRTGELRRRSEIGPRVRSIYFDRSPRKAR